MSDVSELWIRGEYTGAFDIEGLDNLSIVPIPGTLLLLVSGLLGLVGINQGVSQRK